MQPETTGRTTIPEFDPAYVASQSAPEAQIYREEVQSQEPMKSVLENNPEIYFVQQKRGSDWGKWDFKAGAYYDTTTGAKHPAWKNEILPRATRDIKQLRLDLVRWGYCVIKDAIVPARVAILRERVIEQADGERRAGVAFKTMSGQNVHTCINKGACFADLIETSPETVQASAVVEQLINEALGPSWICTSLIAAISTLGGAPQALHQDQAGIDPDSRSPMSVNILTPLTDIDETNGGTLVIPGSHRELSDAVRERRPVGKLPPAINLKAKAGEMVLTDGRLLHGTGINFTDTPRIVMLSNMQKPWLRQQENWMLSVAPDVLETASPKLLQRMGYQAMLLAQTNEGHGFGARGEAGEAAGALIGFRRAADRGAYLRVGVLSRDSSKSKLQAPYTVRQVVEEAKAAARSGHKRDIVSKVQPGKS